MTRKSMRFLCAMAAILAGGAQSFALKANEASVGHQGTRWYTKEEILQFDIGGVRLKMSPQDVLSELQAHGYNIGSRDVYIGHIKKLLSAQELVSVADISTNGLYIGGSGDVDIATCGYEDAVLIGVAAKKGLEDKFGIQYQSHYERDQHHMIGANHEDCTHGYVKEMIGHGNDGSSIHVMFVSTPKGAVVLYAEYEISPHTSFNLFSKTVIEKYGQPSLLIEREGSDGIEGLSWMTVDDKDREELGVHVYSNPNLTTYLRGDDSRWLVLSMGDEGGWLKTVDDAVEQEVDRRMPQIAPQL